jgi:CubicO group peptidase (beta-lactamase class C family)
MTHLSSFQNALLAAALSTLAPNVVDAQSARQRPPLPVLPATDVRQRLDDAMTRFGAFGFSGTVLVAKDGSILLHKGYGLADRERHILTTTATVFPYASIVKGFTAAAVYKLEAEGKLTTSDTIGEYLPGVPASASRITLLQLLTHSSGLPHEADNVAGGATRGEHVRNILRVPLQSEPGTRYAYSNAGYDLLAAIIERVTGIPYESYIREHLLRPAGLAHIGWRSEFDSRLFARGYQEVYRDANDEVTFPAGLIGTAEALYRWGEALDRDAVLPTQARTKLFTPALGDYVNGWFVTKTKTGDSVQITDGDYPGYSARLTRFPSRHAAIVVLTNSDLGWCRLISDRLRDILFGGRSDSLPLVKRSRVDQLALLSGQYRFSSGATVDVRAADGALLLDPMGQEAVSALGAVDPTTTTALAERNRVTADFVEHLESGEFDWIKPMAEFQAPEPYQRLRNFWTTMIATKGELKRYRIVGSAPTRGGMIETMIRFDLDHGTEDWLLFWATKLRGWNINITPTRQRFLASSAEEFASLDVHTGRVTRIRFRKLGSELSIPSPSGSELIATRIR